MIIIPQFDERTHTYRVNGQVKPGVTSILKDLGVTPDYPEGNYASQGTAVHKITELIDKDVLDIDSLLAADAKLPEDQQLGGSIQAYLEFLCDWSPTYKAIEQRLYSDRFPVAGTLDRIAIIGSNTGVLDIKRTNGQPAKATKYQLAMYAILAHDGDPGPNFKRWALRLPKRGKYILVPYTDQGDYQRARSLVDAWYVRKECRG